MKTVTTRSAGRYCYFAGSVCLLSDCMVGGRGLMFHFQNTSLDKNVF